MRRSTALACFLVASISVLLMSSCQKESDSEQGYYLATAYKNDLTVPVTIQYGLRLKRQPVKEDTTGFIGQGIIIEPGKAYETSVFICTANCGPSFLSESDPRYQKNLVKVTISGKEKVDTSCGLYYSLFPDAARKTTCEADLANLFKDEQWVKTKNAAGNIIRREYVIDQADLAEAK
ncbi:hypothetical protein [Niabella hibiscisoli]|uniref:hypothetical protein n=1 Tax=Niabella hibiscisoli TaxID=1825928 RepID=UPI001F0CE9E9|nr:hypothetical protein [Niabella hibiscisoli]MCH5721417.1 hypothetical protein [Niabella hibiscisoli]